MATAGLSPPGSSSYTSGTMHVGDGTWDSSRDDFLLPNLQGLNFATMQYNGMGNRFRDLPQYHTLILGHGVLAAITFLGIVPLAVFLAKYGKDWPGARVSFKLHVYCQILVVFLTTVILVLGWFAVGPDRSLTNPHHGIGVAIYVLILFQFLYGTLMYRRERRRQTFPSKLPFGVWIHKLLGRSIGLLAIIQIALGLTLYGSPKSLFVLYALAGTFLVFLYLVLDYMHKPRVGDVTSRPAASEFYSDGGSYLSQTQTNLTPAPRRRDEHHWGRDLLVAGGAFGAYEAWKTRRDRRRAERAGAYDGPGRPPPGGVGGPGIPPPGANRPPSESRLSYEAWEDEKYNDRNRHTWRNRFLEAAGGFAAYEGVKSLFNRKKRRDEMAEGRYPDGRYRPAMGGNQSMVSETDLSRVEAGQAPTSPNTPRINLGGAAPMTPSMTPSRPPRRPRFQDDGASYDSRDSFEGQPPRPAAHDDGPHTLRDSIAAFGAIAGLREWNRRRRERREYQRTEDIRRQELDNEDVFQRRHQNTYPRPQDASGAHHADSSTLMTGPMGTAPANGGRPGAPDTMHPPLPAAAGIVAGASPMGGSRANITTEQGYSIPPPPPGPPPGGRTDGYQRPEFNTAFMPAGAVQPDPNRLVTSSRYTASNTAANEGSAFGRDYGDHVGRPIAEAAAAGAVGGAMMSGARRTESDLHSPSRFNSRQNSRTRRPDRRGGAPGITPSSPSQLNANAPPPPPSSGGTNGGNSSDPRISLKVHPHKDGQHVTLRRLNSEEAAAERAARRQDRRAAARTSTQRRRNSSFSSGNDEAGGGALSQRYRRTNPGGPPPPASAMRPSFDQPITNIPPPPPQMMSSSALGSATTAPHPPPSLRPPPTSSPAGGAFQPGSQIFSSSGITSPGPYATDTDQSAAFADNRRRRRAERARRLEAARGVPGTGNVGDESGVGTTGEGGGNEAKRVEFQ